MFKAIRIFVLLVILFVVATSTWLTQSRSTDWNNSLWVKVYPINGDGSAKVRDYIATLDLANFEDIESFMNKEVKRYGQSVPRPVRMELGKPIAEQPPALGDSPGPLAVMWWSMKLRFWASGTAGDQDAPAPDVRIFVRYHAPHERMVLENSVGLQKGMVGVVNAYADRRQAGSNNVVIAHEFLHTLGATDKYNRNNGMPDFPDGFAEPERKPRFPQRYAEIMGGRIAESEDAAMIPKSLRFVQIGPRTALEIGLTD